ncbi:unnamed protein product, partial [Sphenostylis stenocarpa]
ASVHVCSNSLLPPKSSSSLSTNILSPLNHLDHTNCPKITFSSSTVCARHIIAQQSQVLMRGGMRATSIHIV